MISSCWWLESQVSKTPVVGLPKELLTIVRHTQDRDLGDRAISALNSAGTLVNGRQICIHVAGITTTARHLFTSSRDFTEGITVGGKIRQDDKDVLFELVGVVLCSGQGKARCNDAFDAV